MRAFAHALRLNCGYIFRIWIVCWKSRRCLSFGKGLDCVGIQQAGKGWLFELLLRKKRLIPFSTGFGWVSFSSGAALRRLQNNLRRSSRFFFSSSSSSFLVLLKLDESEERVDGFGVFVVEVVVVVVVVVGVAVGVVTVLPSALFPFSFSISLADSPLSTLFTLSAFFIFKLIACILLNNPVFLTDVGLIFVVTLSPSILCVFLPTPFSSPLAISAPLGRAGSAYPCWFASKNRSISLRSASTTHSLSPPLRHDCMRR